MLDEEQKIQLIRFMERHPCFWNKSDINYLNSATKGLMFCKLASTIGSTEREVKSGWKSLKKSYMDEKLRQTRRRGNRSPSPFFHYYHAMRFLEKSGDRGQPKTFSTIPAFRRNETKFDDFDVEESPPAIECLSTVNKNENKIQVIIPSRTIIDTNSIDRRRRMDTPTATATANKIRRLITRRVDCNTPTSMPTLTACTPSPITTPCTPMGSPKPTVSSATKIAKSSFLVYMERIYNTVEDERKLEFEEAMIRNAFDWKRMQSSNSNKEM